MIIEHGWYRSPLGCIAISVCENAIVGLHFLGQKHLPSYLEYAKNESTIDRWVLGYVNVEPAACSTEHLELRTKDSFGLMARAAQQLEEYFSGARREFDLPIRLAGTEFQMRVWQELTSIRFGELKTYGDIAETLGMPNASRAVGSAIGRNPISVIVPCHRVVGGAGKLTGYAGGVDRKSWMLRHERQASHADQAARSQAVCERPESELAATV